MKALAVIFIILTMVVSNILYAREKDDLKELSDAIPDGTNLSNGQNLNEQVVFNFDKKTQTLSFNKAFIKNSLHYSNLTASLSTSDGNVPLSANIDSMFGNKFRAGYKHTWSFWPDVKSNVDSIDSGLKNLCAEQNKLKKPGEEKINDEVCSVSKLTDPQLHRKGLNLLLDNKSFRYFSIGAEGSYREHDYNEKMTLEAKQEQNTPYKVTVTYGGIIPPKYTGNSFFETSTAYSFTYKHEREYRDQKAQKICTTFDQIEGAYNCSDFKLGGPEKRNLDIVEFELRKMLSNEKIAVSPRINRDFKNNITGIELPIWLRGNSTLPLNSGAKIGWRSDTDETTVGLFFGAEF